ncbi:PKD domain-containing protein [Candidatus Bathyarchaeota archaeon]|nr:PKD domain-containing protein [Candidatus Bathyarchaeota archaeon]
MKNFFFFLLIFFFLFPTLNCSAISMEWNNTYGGAYDDYGSSVYPTLNGGFIIAGYTSSYGVNDDFYLIYCDFKGTLIWNKTYGGSQRDACSDAKQTIDGGYVLIGFTSSFGAGLSDVYLVKTDSSGKMQFNYTYGGNNLDAGSSIQQTSDGGYIIVGNTWSFGALSSDVYLIKTDIFGNLVWQQHYGGNKPDYGLSVHQTSDGGYIIGGSTASFGAGDWTPDFYLLKTDYTGKLLWDKTYAGIGYDVCYSVEETIDGGYILAGTTSNNTTGDVYVVKTDSSGQLLWNRTYGGEKGEGANYIQQTSDGGYIIAGNTASFGAGSVDIYLVKIDSSGNMEWNTTAGGKQNDLGYNVQITKDGGCVVAGYTNSYGAGKYDAYLVKFSDVVPNQLPKAEAGLDQVSIAGSIVFFDGSNSTDIDGSIIKYSWDFGDGSQNSTQKMTNHVYQVPGNFTVTLVVTDNRGGSATDQINVTITPANKMPIANAGPDQTSFAGSTVTLDGSMSSDPDGSIVKYNWNLGDASILSGKIINYTYANPGNYTVLLTVIDDRGASSEDTVLITVTKIPAKGSIKISIKDSSNKAISGVTVSSTTQPTGQQSLSGETGSEGSVLFSNLTPGSYIFSATKSGYSLKTETITSILDQVVEKTIVIDAHQQGIPGYNYEVILIGMMITLLFLYERKK